MNLKSTGKKYTAEFKRDAISLVVGNGDGLAETAGRLGMGPSISERWARASEAGAKAEEAGEPAE